MATKKRLSLIYEIQNFADTYLGKVTKFQGNGLFRFGVLSHLLGWKWKTHTPPPALIGLNVPRDAQSHRNTHTHPNRYKFDQTDRGVFESTLEATLSSGNISDSRQDIDKYTDFIVIAISTAADKATPTSKSGRPESQPVSDEKFVLIKEKRRQA